MMTIEIGGNLLTALLATLLAVLVQQWWHFRSRAQARR